MAKSYAHCATKGCTHAILFIEQNRKLADRKAEWAESQSYLCSDCQDKIRQAENVKAAEQNQSAGLPSLTGSDKQIAWAEKIRADKLATLEKLPDIAGYEVDAWWSWPHFRDIFTKEETSAMSAQCATPADITMIVLQHPTIQRGLAALKQKTSASWWIDNRDTKLSAIVASLIKSFVPEQPPEQKALELDAATEATVRPGQAKTETVAEINITATALTIKFPEKIESFRLLMRGNGFAWSGSAWTRTLNAFTGTGADRAAEIGHKLLGSGFIVRIYDEAVRANAITGTFAAEQTRWIKRCASGEYKDWFSLKWSYEDDCYKAAMRLHRAKYSKPNVVVPGEFFADVLDFAEINNFAISPAALALIEDVKAKKEAALVVHVEPPLKTKRKKLSEKPAKLDVPENVDISDDLKDD
jgi:hypothetical protein